MTESNLFPLVMGGLGKFTGIIPLLGNWIVLSGFVQKLEEKMLLLPCSAVPGASP
jgi:hypothetical protein